MLLLMNKDISLAELVISGNRVFISRVINNIPSYINDVSEWIESRTSPIGRNNIHILLKQAQISSKLDYLTVTRGISLNDTFWVNNTDNSTSWDKVNPYRNRLSRIISDIALNNNYNGGNLRSPSPDYVVDGSIDKCWKRVQGDLRLYKTAGERYTSLAGLRPYAEYYACQVEKALGVKEYTRYGIVVNTTENGYLKPYTFCNAFTDENNGYIEVGSTKYKHTELRELYKLLDIRSRTIFKEMLLVDSVILNFDRHQGNYGFIFDTNTLKLKSMAPIFDNDCGLGSLLSIQNKTIPEAYQELLKTKQPKTDLGGYINQARISLSDNLVANMKNMYPFHFDRLPSDIDVEDKRIEFMEYIVNSQIKAILSK